MLGEAAKKRKLLMLPVMRYAFCFALSQDVQAGGTLVLGKC